MKKIVITGAAGFIGGHTCSLFTRRGWHVVGTDVTESSWSSFHEFHRCDLLDRKGLIDLVKRANPDAVLHLGAETRVTNLKWEDYAVNVAGVGNVVDAANASSSCKRVVFASTRLICPVYSPGTHVWDYRPPNLYGSSKVEGEKIVRSGRLNVPWVLVRPTGIWGPGFRSPSYRDFFVQIKRGRYFHVGGISPVRTFGFVGNTAYQLFCLVEAPLAKVGESVHYLGDYEPLKVRDWADMIAGNFGRKPLPALPEFVAKSAALTGDILLKIGIDRFPLNSSRYRNMSSDSVYDLAALQNLAPSLPYTLAEGTRLTTRWMETGERDAPFQQVAGGVD